MREKERKRERERDREREREREGETGHYNFLSYFLSLFFSFQVFHRAAKIGSLVNPQLDDFRKIMFNPMMYTTWVRTCLSLYTFEYFFYVYHNELEFNLI